MKKIIPIILLFFVSQEIFSQNSNEVFYPIAAQTYYWESPINKGEIENFIKTHKATYFSYFNKDSISYGYDFTNNGLLNSLHLLDLNKDGVDEIIFNGLSGEEGNRTDIFQKINNKYEIVFSTRQDVIGIKITNSATYLFILDPGCCAEYSIIQKTYKMNVQSNVIYFNQIYQSQLLNKTVKPDSLFNSPIPFKIITDQYKLRFEPKLDDTSTQFYDLMGDLKPTGNVIANFKLNTTGLAFGYKADSLANKWWYVEMDEKSYVSNFKLDDRNSELRRFPTKVIGWLSDKYVKRGITLLSKKDFIDQIRTRIYILDQNEQDCLDKGISMKGCVLNNYQEIDQLLNQVYQRGLLKFNKKVDKKKYLLEQRKWLRYRDQEFKKNNEKEKGNGSMGSMMSQNDNAIIVKKRVLYLLSKL
jgi:uncharacterized protein YecT (DUF1311 family)